jgi:xanthine dehydrogenase molybdopterin-binding subunit B
MPPNEMQSFETSAADTLTVVTRSHPQDSARLHVTGAAAYIDDIREPTGRASCGWTVTTISPPPASATTSALIGASASTIAAGCSRTT